ncbi:hypothetical protein SD70_31930 [Gordoniibacillus kamchatkensis]|uniref:Uncharacterized protein n=1 Tax=Gordoniibacillus kamchatkensis TaxID=1590651 RepID=A0ABR5A5S2_9BACL|nr:hypothetical protein [Paenibacillus sp. VKM B-2647]KIL36083.1 hypothetical protein SD70_31930 [Paenibacillus sp. VKM B-2647]
MALNRRLVSDDDFQEALERGSSVRVFQNDQIISSGGTVTRFTADTVVVQCGVSDIAYHPRTLCEFFEIRKRPGGG